MSTAVALIAQAILFIGMLWCLFVKHRLVNRRETRRQKYIKGQIVFFFLAITIYGFTVPQNALQNELHALLSGLGIYMICVWGVRSLSPFRLR